MLGRWAGGWWEGVGWQRVVVVRIVVRSAVKDLLRREDWSTVNTINP